MGVSWVTLGGGSRDCIFRSPGQLFYSFLLRRFRVLRGVPGITFRHFPDDAPAARGTPLTGQGGSSPLNHCYSAPPGSPSLAACGPAPTSAFEHSDAPTPRRLRIPRGAESSTSRSPLHCVLASLVVTKPLADFIGQRIDLSPSPRLRGRPARRSASRCWAMFTSRISPCRTGWPRR